MKDRGEKNLLSYLFFGAINFTKLNYCIFQMVKKKNWANFQRIIELLTQKIVTKLSKIWAWDPRSGIRRKPIPDPGPRGQKGTGSRIRIRNTAPRLDPWYRFETLPKAQKCATDADMKIVVL
jgi:hypothetical protein